MKYKIVLDWGLPIGPVFIVRVDLNSAVRLPKGLACPIALQVPGWGLEYRFVKDGVRSLIVLVGLPPRSFLCYGDANGQ